MNNNNNNIVELNSVGYVFDASQSQIHPMYKNGGWDKNDSTFIIEAFGNKEWLERLTDEEKNQIAMAGDNEVKFWLWYEEGNAVEIESRVYATKDTNFKNRLTLMECMDYCLKNFYPQNELRYEVENRGEWVEIRGLYINCEDGRMCDDDSLYYGYCFDAKITDKEGVEYLKQMSAEDLKLLASFFPSTIADYKMSQIRQNAELLLLQVEGGDKMVEHLVREILALTK